MQDFRNLLVWQKAHALALTVYKVTSTFPQAELFGLTSQMRRAAASAASNLAEGCGRGGNPN
jgi:four helix bundle protein